MSCAAARERSGIRARQTKEMLNRECTEPGCSSESEARRRRSACSSDYRDAYEAFVATAAKFKYCFELCPLYLFFVFNTRKSSKF